MKNKLFLIIILALIGCEKTENPSLSVSTKVLKYGKNETSMELRIKNTGKGVLEWNIHPEENWIVPSSNSGVGEASIDINIDRTILKEVVQQTNKEKVIVQESILEIESNGGNKKINILVLVEGKFLEIIGIIAGGIFFIIIGIGLF